MEKKILIIMNHDFSKKINFLEKNYPKIEYIYSKNLIEKSNIELNELINQYDIIILGGGPQHLIKEKIIEYPEIINLITIIKICETKNILLIGLCLGCQLIALAYDIKIIHLKYLHIGNGLLDKNTIDYNIVNNDKYLKNINFDLLAKSFSFHYDGIENFNNYDVDNKLNIIAYSKTNVPYIIKHKNYNIYGFQFHPEINNNSINKCLNIFNIKINLNYILDIEPKYQTLNDMYNDIAINFFNTFFN